MEEGDAGAQVGDRAKLETERLRAVLPHLLPDEDWGEPTKALWRALNGQSRLPVGAAIERAAADGADFRSCNRRGVSLAAVAVHCAAGGQADHERLMRRVVELGADVEAGRSSAMAAASKLLDGGRMHAFLAGLAGAVRADGEACELDARVSKPAKTAPARRI